MYKKSFRRRSQRKSFFAGNGRSMHGRGRVRAFNPIDLIESPQVEQSELPEYKINHTFSDFDISQILEENIYKKGYSAPTPIQDQAIAPILAGRDLIGIANTGTGKTAAFLIPLIENVLKDRSKKVLIIAPTRELAVQIRDEFIGFSRNLGLYCALGIGGANIKRQIEDLLKNPNFVIGTPGRLIDLVKLRRLNLFHFSCVVLDEADRMVDIGFIKDIKYIVSLLSKKRQSLFFSATIDRDTTDILEGFVTNPVTVSVKKRETAKNVDQQIIKVMNANQKLEKLHELLIQKGFEKVLVFGRTKHGVQRLSDKLVERGFKVEAIHGNKKQTQRARALERFKRSEIKILIATDVASRGLDIPNVSHIINYDLPETKDAYIHRIGRTGRADKKGVALTFIEQG